MLLEGASEIRVGCVRPIGSVPDVDCHCLYVDGFKRLALLNRIRLSGGWNLADAIQDAETLSYFSQDIERRRQRSRLFSDNDEELAAGRAPAGVGHGNHTRLIFEIVGGKLVGYSISGSSESRRLGISSLDHEILDDAVKHRSVVETLASEKDEGVDRIREACRVEIDGYLAAGGCDDGGHR